MLRLRKTKDVAPLLMMGIDKTQDDLAELIDDRTYDEHGLLRGRRGHHLDGRSTPSGNKTRVSIAIIVRPVDRFDGNQDLLFDIPYGKQEVECLLRRGVASPLEMFH